MNHLVILSVCCYNNNADNSLSLIKKDWIYAEDYNHESGDRTRGTTFATIGHIPKVSPELVIAGIHLCVNPIYEIRAENKSQTTDL